MIQFSDYWFVIILPLLLSIPFLFTLEDALQGGLWRMQVNRTGIRGYVFRSLLANLISSTSFIVLGYIMYVLLCYICLPQFSEVIDTTTQMPYIYANPLLNTTVELYGVFVRVCVFSGICLFMSSLCMLSMQLTHNKFRGVGIVMILNYLLDTLSGIMIVRSKFMDYRWCILSPTELLMTSENWFALFNTSFWWYWFGIFTVILLINLPCTYMLKRRIRH